MKIFKSKKEAVEHAKECKEKPHIKASEFVKIINSFHHVELQRPSITIQSGEHRINFNVSDLGNLRLNAMHILNKNDAVILAKWILETFE